MDITKERLAETMMIYLYSLSKTSKPVNINTFKRYVYLYYLTSSFLTGSENSNIVNIGISENDINIINFDSIIKNFELKDYIIKQGHDIEITENLVNFVKHLLSTTNGSFSSLYQTIKPFVNLLTTYTDQYIFTIFFLEPTFTDATKRSLPDLPLANNKLEKLLEKFKNKISNSNIDEYDILTFWMDFILKNYYKETENHDETN